MRGGKRIVRDTSEEVELWSRGPIAVSGAETDPRINMANAASEVSRGRRLRSSKLARRRVPRDGLAIVTRSGSGQAFEKTRKIKFGTEMQFSGDFLKRHVGNDEVIGDSPGQHPMQPGRRGDSDITAKITRQDFATALHIFRKIFNRGFRIDFGRKVRQTMAVVFQRGRCGTRYFRSAAHT